MLSFHKYPLLFIEFPRLLMIISQCLEILNLGPVHKLLIHPACLFLRVYQAKKPYIARYARLFCLAHSKENPAQSVQVIYIQFLALHDRICGRNRLFWDWTMWAMSFQVFREKFPEGLPDRVRISRGHTDSSRSFRSRSRESDRPQWMRETCAPLPP